MNLKLLENSVFNKLTQMFKLILVAYLVINNRINLYIINY